MLTVQQIADGVHTASQEYPLRKVELFGSFANGKNTPQSDVDLLVEFSQPQMWISSTARCRKTVCWK